MNDYDASVEQMFGASMTEILEGMRRPLQARGYAVSIVIRRWAGTRCLPLAHDPLILENDATQIMLSASAIAAAQGRVFMHAFLRSPHKGDFDLPHSTWVGDRTTQAVREMLGKIDREKLLATVLEELPKPDRLHHPSPKGWMPRRTAT